MNQSNKEQAQGHFNAGNLNAKDPFMTTENNSQQAHCECGNPRKSHTSRWCQTCFEEITCFEGVFTGKIVKTHSEAINNLKEIEPLKEITPKVEILDLNKTTKEFVLGVYADNCGDIYLDSPGSQNRQVGAIKITLNKKDFIKD